jgi:hypothetical protein
MIIQFAEQRIPPAPIPSVSTMRPIAILARTAGAPGPQAWDSVARESHAVAQGLHHRGRIDVRHAIPPVEDIVMAVRGRSTLALRPAPSVILLLQIGSSMRDPYIDWLHMKLRAHRPRTLAWLRPDRLTRNDSFAASTLLLCNQLRVTMFDCRTGFYPHLTFGDDCS